MPFIPHILIDKDGRTHILEIRSEMVLFDGVPASIEPLDQNTFRFKTLTVEVTIETLALGIAFAGTDPTPAAVGVLFGAYLSSLAQQQTLTQSLQRISNEITSLCERLSSGGSLIFPQSHFDPITERALQLFDGTEKMTTVIATILAQPAPLVRAWAAHIQHLHDFSVEEESGEEQTINGEDTSFPIEAEQQAFPVEDNADSPLNQEEPCDGSPLSVEGSATDDLNTLHLPRTWNAERRIQLEQALLTCGASTLKEAMEWVAPRFECTIGAIQGQVYTNGMNIRFKERQKAHSPSISENQMISVLDEGQNAAHEENELPLYDETMPALVPLEEGSASGIVSDGHTQLQMPESEAFTWDNKIDQLRTAFMASQLGTSDAIQEIVARFGWPEARVRNKIYSLRLHEYKKHQQPIVASPVVITQGSQENELKRGNYVWRITIGAKLTQWDLQYSYSEFPEQFKGQEIKYDNQRYRVDKIYSQDVHLSPVAIPSSTELAVSVQS